MKNAMKKLMSLLLVAVLLVSAVPFQASAAYTVPNYVSVVYEVDASGNPTKWINCQVNPETGTIYDNEISKVREAIAGMNPAVASWSYNGQTGGLASISFANVDKPVNVYANYGEKVVPATYTFYVNYGNGTSKQFNMAAGEYLTNALPTDVGNPGYTLKGYYLPDGTEINKNWQVYAELNGVTITASWKQVGCVECGQTSGHLNGCSLASGNTGSNSGSTSGSTTTTSSVYVDVILNSKKSNFVSGDYYRCYLVNGQIQQSDRDAIAAKIAGYNPKIVAWSCGDYGTVTSLMNFNFGTLASPVNIYPVFDTVTNNNVGSSGTVGSTGSTGSTGTGSSEVNKYYGEEAMDDVWLYIYANADMSSPAKRVLLNNYTIASDGILNKAEVMTVVDDYYKASNSNTGIIWKGMYAESAANLRSATALQFIAGDLYDSISGINAKRYEGPVIIKARVTGVSAISTATADTSNPKTGDEIYMAVTALGLSGAALATAMYFFTKKRVVK